MRRIVIAGALLFWAIGCVFVFRSATPNHPDLIGILAVLAVVVPFVLAIAVYAVKEMVWFAKRRRDRQRGFPVEMPANVMTPNQINSTTRISGRGFIFMLLAPGDS